MKKTSKPATFLEELEEDVAALPPVPRDYILWFDGSSRGNPGPSAIGITIKDRSGNPIYQRGERIQIASSIDAEWQALLEGLFAAASIGIKSLECRGDAMAVMMIAAGSWFARTPDMRSFATLLRARVKKDFKNNITFVRIPRAANSEADRLASRALDGAESLIEPLGKLDDVQKAFRERPTQSSPK